MYIRLFLEKTGYSEVWVQQAINKREIVEIVSKQEKDLEYCKTSKYTNIHHELKTNFGIWRCQLQRQELLVKLGYQAEKAHYLFAINAEQECTICNQHIFEDTYQFYVSYPIYQPFRNHYFKYYVSDITGQNKINILFKDSTLIKSIKFTTLLRVH